MKQKDWTIIALVVFISAIVSYEFASKLIVSSKSREQQVEIVSSVPQAVPQPSSTVFNGSSIDPSQLIQVSQNSNASPFGATQQ